MSGDRLAQFQQNIDAQRASGRLVVVTGVDFAQHVLDVAEAARDMADADCDGYLAGAPFYGKLRSALARLDRPSSDGTADSGASRSGTDTAEEDA